ncbi:hypothetical protein L207DRAFT_195300 [Hyaloscypha variabilis F]|uniref:Uncharacterized protein n=1 Tax=Hyaloscypha variabilis (strain UAMH 11265 / GT02V1 / F) TaxID=1149755 RepID=A0A2J6QYN0_HYAVF|nr:hypothetical protein L207DRAFT_195300 [Hyaloscypha variabilis F]
MQFTRSCIAFLLLIPTLALYPNPYLNPTGSVALYTDASCHTNAYANNWTLGGDFCAVLSSPATLGSYDIALRPTCDNGSYADWATYGDTACLDEKTRVPNNNDDTCESLAGVLAVAFICNGFVASGSVATSSSTIAVATTSIDSSGTTSHPTVFSTSRAAVGTGTTSTVLSISVSSTGTPTSGRNSSTTLSSPSAIATAAANRLGNTIEFAAPVVLVILALAGV